MDDYSKLKLSVFESTLDKSDKHRIISYMESCDDEDFQQICESAELIVYGESLMNEAVELSPIRKMKAELQKIKDSKPDEFSKDNEVSEYVNKNYDKLMKCSDILEKEPSKLRSNEVKYTIGTLVATVGWYITMLTFNPLAIGLSSVLMIILAFVYPIIDYVRKSDDRKSIDDLTKIRKSLKSIQDNKRLKIEDKKKITKIIDAIDDAETEMNAKFKLN